MKSDPRLPRLVRIAHERPDLREKMLPLIRKMAGAIHYYSDGCGWTANELERKMGADQGSLRWTSKLQPGRGTSDGGVFFYREYEYTKKGQSVTGTASCDIRTGRAPDDPWFHAKVVADDD